MNKYLSLLKQIEDLLEQERELGTITELQEMTLVEINYRAVQMLKRGDEMVESAKERMQA